MFRKQNTLFLSSHDLTEDYNHVFESHIFRITCYRYCSAVFGYYICRKAGSVLAVSLQSFVFGRKQSEARCTEQCMREKWALPVWWRRYMFPLLPSIYIEFSKNTLTTQNVLWTATVLVHLLSVVQMENCVTMWSLFLTISWFCEEILSVKYISFLSTKSYGRYFRKRHNCSAHFSKCHTTKKKKRPRIWIFLPTLPIMHVPFAGCGSSESRTHWTWIQHA